MTTGIDLEAVPTQLRPLDFSADALARVEEFTYTILKSKVPGLPKKNQLQIVRPFAIEHAVGGSAWRSEEYDAFNDTISGIEKLLKSGDTDKYELGKLLYARCANRVTRGVSFIHLAAGDSKKAISYSLDHLVDEEIKAQTGSPPVLFD